MNPRRKKLLLAALGMIAVLYGGDWARQNLIEKPKQDRLTTIGALEANIQKLDKQIAVVRQESQWLQFWESQSLPSDTEVARSLYQAWLLELADYVGLSRQTVNSSEPVNHQGRFSSITFSLRGVGNLEQLTKFLFEFYNAGHLHQVRSISMTPISRTNDLDLGITIEALVMPRATRRDRLSTQRVYRLASAALDDYQPIPQRNLFAVGGGGSADPTNHTYLTSITYVGDRPEAWFTLRTGNTVLKLRDGDQLVQAGDKILKLRDVDDLQRLRFDGLRDEIGNLSEIQRGSVLVRWSGHLWQPAINANGDAVEFLAFAQPLSEIGTVSEIGNLDLVLESDGERWLLTIGDNLAEAFALPPEF